MVNREDERGSTATLGGEQNGELVTLMSPRRHPGNSAGVRRWIEWVVVWTVTIGWGGLAEGGMVYLEDSPAALELADEAAQLRAQGRLGEASQRLQRLVESYPDKLMPMSLRIREPAELSESEMASAEGGYLDAVLWARQQMDRDQPLRDAYRQRYAMEARRALTEAIDRGIAADAADEGGQRGAILVNPTAVAGVWDRYAVTEAGMDAALTLVAFHLERGESASAGAWLDRITDHPDRAARAAEMAELGAWSAAMAGDLTEAQRYLSADRLHAEAQPIRQEQTEALLAVLTRLRLPAGGDGMGESLTAEAIDAPPLERPLWQTSLRQTDDGTRRQLQPRTSNFTTVQTDELLPVAVTGRSEEGGGGLLLINDGSRVVALDQVSGQVRWTYEAMPDDDENDPAGDFGQTRRQRVMQDARSLAVNRRAGEGGACFAVLGEATSARRRNRFFVAQNTRLVRVELKDGTEGWSVEPGDLDEGLRNASFHGTPVLSGGRVLVMARRSQASSFQDSYLLAVDANTGRLAWRRHLASTAGPNRGNSVAALSKMTLVDGVVYFCDNLGVAAAIDAERGQVRWVRVLNDEAAGQAVPRAGAEAAGRGFGDRDFGIGPAGGQQTGGEVLAFSVQASPALVEAGLVLPVQVGNTRGLVLDPATGAVRQGLTFGSPIASAYDVQAVGGDLLVIGEKLRRLDGRTLKPRWQELPATASQAPDGYPKVTILGQTLLVARGANMPLRELAWANGALQHEHRLPRAGRVVVADRAWVVASERIVGSYLDWSKAYAEMGRRAAAQPTSIEPGLSMALMAANAGEGRAVDEGVDRALACSHLRDPRHQRPAAATR